MNQEKNCNIIKILLFDFQCNEILKYKPKLTIQLKLTSLANISDLNRFNQHEPVLGGQPELDDQLHVELEGPGQGAAGAGAGAEQTEGAPPRHRQGPEGGLQIPAR